MYFTQSSNLCSLMFYSLLNRVYVLFCCCCSLAKWMTKRRKCGAHHIKDTCNHHDQTLLIINLDHAGEVMFVNFLYNTVILLPHFSLLYSLKRYYGQSHLRGEELCYISLKFIQVSTLIATDAFKQSQENLSP